MLPDHDRPNSLLVSGSADKTIRVWDLTQPVVTPHVLFVADAAITTLLAHPTQPLLIAGDMSGQLHWLDIGSYRI
jgi:WD40 repeat protein